MGVPGFFGWLLRNFKNKILLKKLDKRPSHLYIDANCLFHPECFKTIDNNPDIINLDELENLMFNNIIEYLDLIEKYVNPKQLMFIAVDGVVPMSKVNQQRKRRYKSTEENMMKNKLKDKHKIKYNNIWSNVKITPGTLFMEKLHKKLLSHYEKKSSKSKISYIYSSYHTTGEGEHKILQHIKKNNNKINCNNVVIYGLDADLIFLSLTCNIDNIYLLRETQNVTNSNDFNTVMIYASMCNTKQIYNKLINDMCDKRIIKSNQNINFINDFIFICFLLGNDFLPHFSSLDIHNGGLDYIIKSYITTYEYRQDLLIDKKNLEINNEFFIDLINDLASYEDIIFKKMLLNKKKFINKGTTEYEKELWEYENKKYYDPIKLGVDNHSNYKFRYYEYYFNVKEHQEEFIDNLVRLYLQGIVWVYNYYFNKCKSWRWFYPYSYAPFLSDIYSYIVKHNINLNDITFNKDKPIKIMEQLITVIPPIYSNILPEKYQYYTTNEKSQIIDLYPIKYKIDTLYKDKYWKGIPLIPTLNINRIINTISNVELTKHEQLRNKNFDEFIF